MEADELGRTSAASVTTTGSAEEVALLTAVATEAVAAALTETPVST